MSTARANAGQEGKSVSNFGLSVYRVDTVRGEQGNTFQVVRCEPVASFDDPEHAAFLVDLLMKGGAHHG